jgi:hypothetical protein
MRHIRELIQAFATGGHLTDKEMVTLRDAYRAVRLSTAVFGERYWLVTTDAGAAEQRLDSHLFLRGVK